MILSRKWKLGSILLSLIVLVTFAALVPLTAANTPQGDVLDYLPLIVSQPPLGIYGLVTENGAPAADISLDLRFYDGANWSTAATTTTNANGLYSFLNMPGLGPNQRYYVRYLNGTVPSRLYTWHALFIDTYTTGSEVNGGDFDVANINMVSPAPGAGVGFPVTFSWDLRPATPSDSYELNVFDPADSDPYFYNDPPLGYVNSYVLNNLPGGFSYNTEYGWDMWVYGTGGNGNVGNWGISYYYYIVVFLGSDAAGETIAVPNASVHNGMAPDQLITK